MISRNNRFHGQASLRRMHGTSQTVRGSIISLKYTRNQRRGTYRAAVVVSRKVSKSAVVRNRIRRRVYENVRILSSTFVEAYDLVFIVYDERLASIPAGELRRELTRICKKAKLTTDTAISHDIVIPKENS